MGYKVDQSCLQSLITEPTAASTAQIVLESLIEQAAGAIAGQVELSVLYEPFIPVPALASMVTAEVLSEDDGNFYASMVTAEVLSEDDGNFYADGVWIEVLFDFEELSPNCETYNPMSDFLFPALPGLTWDITKTPKFSTGIAPHVSAREVRVSNYAYPVWVWEMKYEFLRAGSESELQTLMGFFLARSGSFDTFLYKDPDEVNVMTGVTLGTGDGSQRKWDYTKTFACFVEPCGYVDPATIKIYFDDVEQLTGWVFVSPNQVEFTLPVSIGTVITTDYTWYYRVRFGEDTQTYNQFMFHLWELGTLTLQSVKP